MSKSAMTTSAKHKTKIKRSSIIINVTMKEPHKKVVTSSGSGSRRMSLFSTMQASRVGSMTRRSILMTSDGRSMDKSSLAGGKGVIQVFDDLGRDVTPRPLYQPEPTAAVHRQSKVLSAQDFAGVTQTEFLSSLSAQQTSGGSISLAGPFSRTYGSSSITKSSTSTESMAEEIVEPGSRDTLASFSDVQVRREEVPEQLTKEDLEKQVDIFLTETETIWLFDMPTLMISTESEEADSVRKNNIAYMELCKNRVGNDRYTNRMMQTINGAPKTKEVQCDKIVMSDKESTSSSIIDLESVILSRIQEEVEDRSEAILKSEKFNQDLFYMERVLMENIFQPKLAAYRELPVFLDPERKSAHSESESHVESEKEEEEEEEETEEELSVRSSLLLELGEVRKDIPPPFMEALWSYGCDLTRGNNDLLAVGYGQFRFKEQKKGLACCWSLKNPMWPERVYHCSHGVTALDFSAANPNLLAVGLFNGTIEVFNVQTHNPTSVLDTSESYEKHLGPVWQLKWVEQDRGTKGEDKGEILVSISADGRVTKWFVRKGLSCTDLMKLKRTAGEKKKGAEKKSEALISRQAPGLAFDFHPKDSVQPVLTFTSTTNVIYDVMWSPSSAYVFAAVNETRVEVWDLSVSTLDPLIVNPATGNLKFTTVLFAKNADCLLIGDSDGLVTVYALRNMAELERKKMDLLQDLIGSTLITPE
ncbi:hypothetical protein JD844_017818 [Phrynosoma platyrhinos]|uniref:Dynein axonemal intermediate chain 4 n=1 Tax=Phrynosoma platyrhinos TaxID=52577 RepID=A0ABQ7SMD7_PHRPL|nr:hypothetical protein JD844_017818 [Phrynosoma platyrhinos]